MLYTSIINMGLRGVTLVSKFILVLFMGKYMSIEDLGTYGLFTVTCTLLLNLVGFNFHAYNSRELINNPKEKHGAMLRDQALFHLISYILVLPLIPLIFKLDILDWSLLGWLYAILILEHICQEIERILITFAKPIMANVVLFIRSAAWVYVIIATFVYLSYEITLGHIWQYWIAGTLLAILFGLFQLKFINWQGITKTPVNYTWIYSGLKSASYLFAGTMLYQGMLFIDRSVLQYFHGEKAVGIYTFYWSIGTAIYTFVYAGVISILHPKIINSFSIDKNNFSKLIKKMYWQSSALFLIIFFILWLFLDYVLRFTGKEELIANKDIFLLISAGLLILVMSTASHYVIYCHKLDKQIMLTTLLAFSVDIVANISLVPNYAITGTTLSISIALLTLALGKLFFTIKIQKA